MAADRLIRVLEVSRETGAAAYAGKLFARWGADVVRPELEPSTGDLSERAYLHSGKDARPAHDLQGLIASPEFDVLISDVSPAEIERLGLPDSSARVRVFVTPFGRTGPRRDSPATAASLLALGGYTYLSGDRGRAPLTMPGKYPYYQAGSFAYIAALAHVLRGGADPVTLDVSVLETVVSLHQFTDTMWTFQQVIRSRHGNRWENLCPTTLLPCRDGWVSFNIVPNFWEPFALWIGGAELLDDPRYATNELRMEREDEVEALIIEFLRGREMFDVFQEGQETWRVPVGYAPSLAQLLADPHLLERAFFREIEVGGRTVRTPGSPFRFAGEGPPEEPRAAPTPSSAIARPEGARPAPALKPLEGVQVLDLTRIWSGPLATRILADLGADVLKLEAPAGRGGRRPAHAAILGAQPDAERPWNQQALFNKLNRNKRSLALDLKQPESRDVFLRLVEQSDVLVENFSARAMDRLGLGYEVLRERNPRLIYMQMPALGAFGPYRDYVGLGPSIEPLSGLTAVMGYGPGEPRVTSQAVTDAAAGVTAATAIMTALARRERTGTGALVDLSQGEAMTAYIGEFVLRMQLEEGTDAPYGNAHPTMSPHGVYRCRGEDAWICITAADETQWHALAEAAGRDWATDPRFATLAGRIEHRTALDQAIEGWTRSQDRLELSEALLHAGIAAGAVQSAPDFLNDPHLNAVGFYPELATPDSGAHRYDGSPVTTNQHRPYADWAGAPALGQDNNRVLEGLGFGADTIRQLWERGVVVDRPPA